MTRDEFEGGLDRYGGDPGRWPQALRAEAEALIARDPAAAKLAAQAARLDSILANAMTPRPVDSAFVGRVLTGIGSGARHETVLRPTPRLAAWAGAAMITLLSAGYAAGAMLPASSGEDTLAGIMFGSSQSSDSSALESLL